MVQILVIHFYMSAPSEQNAMPISTFQPHLGASAASASFLAVTPPTKHPNKMLVHVAYHSSQQNLDLDIVFTQALLCCQGFSLHVLEQCFCSIANASQFFVQYAHPTV